MECVILMKSGAKIRFKCDDYEVIMDDEVGMPGRISYINGNFNRVDFLDMREIAAIYSIGKTGKEGEPDG